MTPDKEDFRSVVDIRGDLLTLKSLLSEAIDKISDIKYSAGIPTATMAGGKPLEESLKGGLVGVSELVIDCIGRATRIKEQLSPL